MKTAITFPALLASFFTDRLARQRQASPHTIGAYRDTFRLLLYYAQARLGRPPSALTIEDLEAPLIGDFLDQQEQNGNCARSRNLRLTAIRSFFRYIAFEMPGHAALIQRVLAIPSKRHDRTLVDYLTLVETEALLAAPDLTTRLGRRDYALLLLAVSTGLRVSELVSLSCQDVVLGTGAHVHCTGKGRKERCTPLTRSVAKKFGQWLHERNGAPSDTLFQNARGQRISPDGVQYILTKHVSTAAQTCPTLKQKRVSPHVLRHTTAMHLLESGVDRTVIALWLGHESVETTQIYVNASMALKEAALKKATPLGLPPSRRFQVEDDKLLTFLKSL
jgi:site-specific recombinase XerD